MRLCAGAWIRLADCGVGKRVRRAGGSRQVWRAGGLGDVSDASVVGLMKRGLAFVTFVLR